MTKTNFFHDFRQYASLLSIPSSAFAALAFAVLLACVPVLTSTPLSAQETAHPVQLDAININSADVETLAEGLNGVGLSRARDIVQYRETYGPFSSVDELVEVKGIGMATVNKNRSVITLE